MATITKLDVEKRNKAFREYCEYLSILHKIEKLIENENNTSIKDMMGNTISFISCSMSIKETEFLKLSKEIIKLDDYFKDKSTALFVLYNGVIYQVWDSAGITVAHEDICKHLSETGFGFEFNPNVIIFEYSDYFHHLEEDVFKK